MKLTQKELKNIASSRYIARHQVKIIAWALLTIGWTLAWLVPCPMSIEDGVWTNLVPGLAGLTGYLALVFGGLILLKAKSRKFVSQFMAENGHLVEKEL